MLNQDIRPKAGCLDSNRVAYKSIYGIILLKGAVVMRKTKQCIMVFLLLAILLSLTACIPPEGYTKEHHTYEEIVAFANKIDPNAVVSETFTDTVRVLNDSNWKDEYREWSAVIHGIECHIASCLVYVGEFLIPYYVIDTDYDYYLLKGILSEQQPEWSLEYDNHRMRYQVHNLLSVDTPFAEAKEELSIAALEQLWSAAYEIYTAYNANPVRKELRFVISVPYNHNDEYIKMSSTWFFDFTEQGKQDFFARYAERWDLLESGLPIVD